MTTSTETCCIDLTTETFDREVLESKGPVMVDFWAPWCGPCAKMAPVVEELATRLEGVAKVCKVNVDEHPELGGRFSVRSIPSFLFFSNGKLVRTQVGAIPAEILEQTLNSVDEAA